jgi:hypothetical protein
MTVPKEPSLYKYFYPDLPWNNLEDKAKSEMSKQMKIRIKEVTTDPQYKEMPPDWSQGDSEFGCPEFDWFVLPFDDQTTAIEEAAAVADKNGKGRALNNNTGNKRKRIPYSRLHDKALNLMHQYRPFQRRVKCVWSFTTVVNSRCSF